MIPPSLQDDPDERHREMRLHSSAGSLRSPRTSPRDFRGDQKWKQKTEKRERQRSSHCGPHSEDRRCHLTLPLMDRFPNSCSPNTPRKVTDRKRGFRAANPRAAQSGASHASAGKDHAQRLQPRLFRLNRSGAKLPPFQGRPTLSRRIAIVSHRSAGVLITWRPKLFRPSLLQNPLRLY